MSYEYVSCKNYDIRKKECLGVWEEVRESIPKSDFCTNIYQFKYSIVN